MITSISSLWNLTTPALPHTLHLFQLVINKTQLVINKCGPTSSLQAETIPWKPITASVHLQHDSNFSQRFRCSSAACASRLEHGTFGARCRWGWGSSLWGSGGEGWASGARPCSGCPASGSCSSLPGRRWCGAGSSAGHPGRACRTENGALAFVTLFSCSDTLVSVALCRCSDTLVSVTQCSCSDTLVFVTLFSRWRKEDTWESNVVGLSCVLRLVHCTFLPLLCSSNAVGSCCAFLGHWVCMIYWQIIVPVVSYLAWHM